MKIKIILALAWSLGLASLIACASEDNTHAAGPSVTPADPAGRPISDAEIQAIQAAGTSAAPTEPVAPAPPLTVAVLPFDGSGDGLESKADDASVLLSAKLSEKPELMIVERAEVDKILSEHALSSSGIIDPGKAVQTGNLLGARVLITGRLIRTGDTYVLVAKIMSTETSRVFGATAEGGSADELSKLAADLANAVADTLAKQAAAFTPPVEPWPATLARLHGLTAGKKLPSIQVKIAERDMSHFSSSDPAATTEFEKTLSELGFEIVDPTQSGKVADLVISGNGLSQTGAQNGKLVSARGRVEVEVVRHADGKVLVVDRETSVAVDTSAAVAGKTALQNAAQTLVERLVPKLIQP